MPAGKSKRDTTHASSELLDRGVVITGELLVKLMGLKLLPVKVRLLVSSKDLAAALGLDWWREEAERVAEERAKTRRREPESKPQRTSNEMSTSRRRHAQRNGSRGRS
jgi:hypothetical protein